MELGRGQNYDNTFGAECLDVVERKCHLVVVLLLFADVVQLIEWPFTHSRSAPVVRGAAVFYGTIVRVGFQFFE